MLKKICLQPTSILQTKELLSKEGSSVVGRMFLEELDLHRYGMVNCTISLSKTYYTPGENISFAVEILNQTSITLNKILVDFISIEEYDVTGREKDCSKTVTKKVPHMVI